MEKNYESCSFRLHGMLENVKIVTTRPGLPYNVQHNMHCYAIAIVFCEKCHANVDQIIQNRAFK